MSNPGLPPQIGAAPVGMPGAAAPRPPANPNAFNPLESPEYVTLGKGEPEEVEDLHIDALLNTVVDLNASDLHICVDSPPVVRVDGKLRRLNYRNFTPPVTQRMLYEIITDKQITKFEQTLELDCSYQVPHRARFRVNMYRDKGSVAAAFRLIPTKIPTLEQLGLPQILKQISERPRGLVLVTGPTGSGKSTTLAAMINHINMNFAHHILTIEDPIEYVHTHKVSILNQRELGGDTMEFRNALRASLREDPDVILVGEMRDTETIALAITAAETGHLVFATLHTNNAAESIDRMIDVFPPGQQEQIRIQLANNIVAIVAQQLLKRANQPGRVAINEIMIATPAVRNLIRENKTHQIPSSIQTGANFGMISMDQCLRDYYNKGVITLEDAMARAMNVEELKKMINLGGPNDPRGGAARR
ncbi:MAG: type IV pilus twitching motility protein PilT [Fimbriimonadaceae bacterium]|nr:type IV pilus twitching motility protein PilT [Fimbriimonadaceae bacterium]